jgi:hypothetical protein
MNLESRGIFLKNVIYHLNYDISMSLLKDMDTYGCSSISSSSSSNVVVNGEKVVVVVETPFIKNPTGMFIFLLSARLDQSGQVPIF